MPKTIQAAVIGCGAIHGMHADAIERTQGVRLAAVCDVRRERAEASAERYGCQVHTGYRELLESPDIDAVHICTPHHLHGEMALAALRAGKYVLVEKPMAATVGEARAMIDEDARAGGGRLCAVFQNRYNEAAAALRRIVDDGRFGALAAMRGAVVWHRGADYYADDWHGRKALECGGVLINQAIHTLDMMQWLCGGAASVKGAVSTDALMGAIEVEDSAHMRIEMKSGVVAVFHATVAWARNDPVEVEAVFEDATVLMKGDRLYRVDTGYETLCDPRDRPIGEKDYWGSGHLAQVRDFYRCIGEGRPFFIDGAQGIEAVKLVRGLYESSETGKVVYL